MIYSGYQSHAPSNDFSHFQNYVLVDVTHRDRGGSGTRFLGHTDGSLRSPPRVRNLVPERLPVPVCKEVCPQRPPTCVVSHLFSVEELKQLNRNGGTK